jgi:CIC family chloride channel protein
MSIKNTIVKLLSNFLKWRVKHLSDRRFLVLLSFIIGVAGGIVASILKTLIHFIENLIHSKYFSGLQNLWYFAFPLIGIFISLVFIRYIAKNRLPEGVTLALYSIGKNNGVIKRLHMYGHVFTSVFTVGFGGSVGLEGPSVATGSAIGSNIGQLFHLNNKRKSLLIGCGSAAALSALFNAPVAAVIFVLEIILLELKIAFIIPLLVSSVTATLISKVLIGDDLLFNFGELAPIVLKDIPFYIILGVFTGFLGVYFLKTSLKLNSFALKFGKYRSSYLFFGTFLGLILILFPTLFGEGYYTLRSLLKNQDFILIEKSIYGTIPYIRDLIYEQWFLLLFLVASLFLKVYAGSFTRLAGGSGGVFASTLFMGGLAGFILSRLVNLSNFDINLPENNFILVGMSGVLAGVMHSPLTAIFLIAEITQGYELFIPLMIVVAISYGSAINHSKFSFYTRNLAEKGNLIAHDRDKTLLTEIGVLKVIEKDLICVHEDGTLKDLIQAISKSKRNIFPIINSDEELMGVILLDDVRHLIFKPENYGIELKALMHPPPAFVNFDEHLDTVMDKFDSTNAWNLPVLKDGKYYGFLSKSKIFTVYRDKLSCSNDIDF